MKNRFVSEATKRIELDEGEWVDIKAEISWEDYCEHQKSIDYGMGTPDKQHACVLPLYKKVITAWSFRRIKNPAMPFSEENSEVIPCTPENIEKLDATTILELLPLITQTYNTEKKSSQPSDQELLEETKKQTVAGN